MKSRRGCKFGFRNSKSGRLIVNVKDRWGKGALLRTRLRRVSGAGGRRKKEDRVDKKRQSGTVPL